MAHPEVCTLKYLPHLLSALKEAFYSFFLCHTSNDSPRISQAPYIWPEGKPFIAFFLLFGAFLVLSLRFWPERKLSTALFHFGVFLVTHISIVAGQAAQVATGVLPKLLE